MSPRSDKYHLMKDRQHWVLLFPDQGQNNLSLLDFAVEVKIFGSDGTAFLTNARCEVMWPALQRTASSACA